jgi:integrase
MTQRFQVGSLEKVRTKLGLCWYVRFREATGARPRIRIGLVQDFPTKKSAQNAAADLRKEFNGRPALAQPHTFGELIHKYIREEMPVRYSTSRGYLSYLENHIKPKWSERRVDEVRANEVRLWLRELPLQPKTVGHIRDLMRTLYRFAMLWEWIPVAENPMTLFRIERSTKRKKKPRVLSPAEFHKLAAAIREPYQTMVVLAACLGLRCSELLALHWGDFDWVKSEVRVERAIVNGRLGPTKTEHSEKGLPLHPKVAERMLAFYQSSTFREIDDYVFASPFSAGEKPYHSYRVQQYVIKPSAKACGLGDGIGWHTLRHSYRSWLDKTGAPIGVQRDLMRHSDIRTTMNNYGDSFMDDLREANGDVVGVLLQ